MSTAWYEKWFDEDYLLVYKHRDGDDADRGVKLLVEQFQPESGALVLDVACGTGRHAEPLARRGLRVVGTDLSAVLLQVAARRLDAAGFQVPLVRADLRHLPFRPVFDLVVSFFTSFGYFSDPADDRQALRSLTGTLRPGAGLLLDLINPEHLKQTLVPESSFERDGVRVQERRRLEHNQVVKDITIEREGSLRHVQERVRLYDRATLESWLGDEGVSLFGAHGDYDASPPGPAAPRLILLGRRDA